MTLALGVKTVRRTVWPLSRSET